MAALLFGKSELSTLAMEKTPGRLSVENLTSVLRGNTVTIEDDAREPRSHIPDQSCPTDTTLAEHGPAFDSSHNLTSGGNRGHHGQPPGRLIHAEHRHHKDYNFRTYFAAA